MPDPGDCRLCGTAGAPNADVSTCCSSHLWDLCHRCYRRTHFVQVCVEGCRSCERQGLPVVLAHA